MRELQYMNRRTVLKSIGAGAAVGTTLSNTAVASGGEDKSYRNGNGLDVFLNEKARFKENPIWDGEIANRMGKEVVDVAVGAMTSIDHPNPEVPPEAPFAFAPQVVKVSPGVTVRWTWVSNPFEFPIPHDVTSLVDEDGEVVLEPHSDQRYHHQAAYKESLEAPEPDEEDLPTFSVEFTERGNHLYYCTPHGAPFEELGGEHPIHFNVFGMRGAVKVAGRPL